MKKILLLLLLCATHVSLMADCTAVDEINDDFSSNNSCYTRGGTASVGASYLGTVEYSTNSATNAGWIITQEINDLSSKQVELNIRNTGYGNAIVTIGVLSDSDRDGLSGTGKNLSDLTSKTSWVSLTDVSTDNTSEFETKTVNLSTYSSEIGDRKCLVLLIQYYASRNYVKIDGFRVSSAATCAAPASVTAVALGATTARVTLPESGDYEIVCSTSSGVPAADATPDATITGGTTTTLTGLTAETDYYVFARKVCDESDKSSWGAAAAITTGCAAVTTIDEEFTSWNNCYAKGGTYGISVYSNRIDCNLTSSTQYAWIATQEIENLNAKKVEVDIQEGSSTADAQLTIGVIDDRTKLAALNPADPAACGLVVVNAVSTSKTDGFETKKVNLATTLVTAAHKFVVLLVKYPGSQMYIKIDGFRVDDSPCPDPYTRSVTEGRLGTICLPYESASTSGADFYEIDYKGDGFVHFVSVAGDLQAGHPYLFEATADLLTVNYKNATYVDVLNKTLTNGFVGTYEAITVPEGMYGVNAENVICPAGEGVTMGANKAYIDLSAVATTPQPKFANRPRMALRVQGETPTGTDNIQQPALNSRKELRNGQLVIIRNGVEYNAAGQIIK